MTPQTQQDKPIDLEALRLAPKVEVSKLTAPLLDYWVARAEELETPEIDEYGCAYVRHDQPGDDGWWTQYKPSSDWAIGGPIIERERIELIHYGTMGMDGAPWEAQIGTDIHYIDQGPFDAMGGSTPLQAAMRAYVASKYGDHVECNP